MKRVFLFLLLMVCTQAYAQKPGNTAYADISGGGDEDTYYILFAAQGQIREKKLDMKDVPGHSWVVLAKEDAATKRSEVAVYGYWPDKLAVEEKNPKHSFMETVARAGRRPCFLPNLIAEVFAQSVGTEMRAYFEITRTIILWNHVPGMIKDELAKAMKYETVAEILLKVNKEQYEKAKATAECYKAHPPAYHLFYVDCVRFQMDVAASIGMQVPKRKWVYDHSWLPVDYMKEMVRKFPYEKMQQLSSCKIYQRANGDYFIKPLLVGEKSSK